MEASSTLRKKKWEKGILDPESASLARIPGKHAASSTIPRALWGRFQRHLGIPVSKVSIERKAWFMPSPSPQTLNDCSVTLWGSRILSGLWFSQVNKSENKIFSHNRNLRVKNIYIFVILKHMEHYLVVLMNRSPIPNDVEHIFICVLVISTHSL